MEQTRNFKLRVEAFQNKFGLSNWKINLIFPSDNVPHVSGLSRAKTLANPQYYVAEMTVYPILLAAESEWDEVIVHELVHITMALYDFLVDNLGASDKKENEDIFYLARESSTSQLTSIIMRLLNPSVDLVGNGLNIPEVKCDIPL
jgi:hypothetical protein